MNLIELLKFTHSSLYFIIYKKKHISNVYTCLCMYVCIYILLKICLLHNNNSSINTFTTTTHAHANTYVCIFVYFSYIFSDYSMTTSPRRQRNNICSNQLPSFNCLKDIQIYIYILNRFVYAILYTTVWTKIWKKLGTFQMIIKILKRIVNNTK